MFFRKPAPRMPTEDEALPGRSDAVDLHNEHFVLKTPLKDVPPNHAQAMFGMGCFWGAEKRFWGLPGVYTTAVGYSGGYTENPSYEEVCSGRTGHNEVVWLVFDPEVISFEALLSAFFESHDPTQGMRQGHDVGTQYRSGVYCFDEGQREQAQIALESYQSRLSEAGYDAITTEVVEAGPFYYAENYHQQYLAKNPAGYCGLGGTGVSCPVGIAT